MTRLLMISLVVLGLAGCAAITDRLGLGSNRGGQPSERPVEPAQDIPVLDLATAAPPPQAGARTVDQLDTTTPEQRAAAATPAGGGRVLGSTVASLGDATQPGLWLKTPLVQAEAQGRVTNPATGKSSAVTLLPLAGAATAGSQMSLSALRLIGASLTELTEVEVSLEE